MESPAKVQQVPKPRKAPAKKVPESPGKEIIIEKIYGGYTVIDLMYTDRKDGNMKKILVSLLCAVMVVTFMPSMAFATASQTPQDIENEQPQAEEDGSTAQSGTETAGPDAQTAAFEGAGTAENPYLIKSADDLKTLAEKVNKGETGYASAVYKQTAEINLEGSAEKQWTPIGTETHKFTGTFIGTGFEIKGLYIDNANLANAGLFGYIASPAKLEGITLDGAAVTGKSDVGTIAGAAFTGTAQNCTVKGKITVKGNYKVGGMFGGGYVKLSNCKVEAEAGSTVTGIHKENDLEGDNVGGLIGFRGEGNIKTEGCSVSGVTVAGTRKVGGLIGSAYADNTVENCSVSNVSLACNAPYDYAKGTAKNQLCVGGLVGIYHKSGDNGGSLSNCTVENVNFSVTDEQVKNENWAIMGIISGGYRASSLSGASAPDGQISMSNVTVSGTNTGSNAEEKFPGSVAMNGEQKLFAKGTGTEADPYIISSINELKILANSVKNVGVTYEGKYFKVADGTILDLSSEKWASIGTSPNKFMGTFDGNGATVKGLTDNGEFGCYGLFGYISGAKIKNIVFTDVNMTYNGSNRGALVGYLYGTNTIENIEVSGKIIGNDYVGGIAGKPYLNDTNPGTLTISNCINNATIEGKLKVGGIIGYARADVAGSTKTIVKNCKNNGNVTGDYIGGIAGWAFNAELKGCTNTGNVTGKTSAGGVVGNTNQNSVITNASNSGVIEADKAGGIIGVSNSGNTIVSQSANTGKVTGVAAAGGIIGGTAAAGDAIDNCYNGGDIKAIGEGAIAAGIYGYNNSTSPVVACVNDAKVEASNGTIYHIGLSNYWYEPAPGKQIATCYYIEDNKIYAVAADGKADPVEQPDMSRTELAEVLNEAGGVPNYWQAQNDSVQPDPIIPGALDEGRSVAIKDKDGNVIEGYTSLEDAVKAAKDGQTILLEDDITLDETLVIKGDKEVTLDLNGNVLTLKEGVNKALIIVGDKTNGQDKTVLTLTDTASLKGGIKCTASTTGIFVSKGASMTTKNVNISFEDKDASAANIAIAVQGELTVEEGTKIDSTEYGIGALENSKVVINGGEITAKEAAAGGNGTWHDTEITINGGTLTSTESAGIYHPQSGKLTLNGGTITGLTGVQMCAGELVIPENSTVKVIATGEDQRKDKGAGDGPINDGAAISIVNREYPGGTPKADISGGSFKADHNKAVLAYTWNAKAEGEKHSEWKEAGTWIDISGGTYNTDVDKALLKGGFEMVKGADGNYTVEDTTKPPYIPPTPTPQKPTIEAEEGATVTLSKDGTTATITVDKDATLKDVLLNGQSLGAVTEVPNLKPGDKLVVIVETAEEKAERLTKGVENTTIKLYYKKGEIGKGWIKLRYKKSYGYKVDNYEIFRSAKKKTNFGKKAWFVTKTNKTKGFYKNGKSVKKGTRYYYKMRGVREIDGKKVYTKWSNIVMRTGR